MTKAKAKTKRRIICKRCNRDRIHYAKGYCHSCWIYLFTYSRDKEKWKQNNKRWATAHPEYFKGYYQRRKDIWKKYWKETKGKPKGKGRGRPLSFIKVQK